MGNTSATALSLVRLPATRAPVPLDRVPLAAAPGPRVESRVEEVAATAKVIRYDEAPARLRPRGERRTAEQGGGDSRASGRPVRLAEPLRGLPRALPYGGAAPGFVAQILGQASGPQPDQPLARHRDGPVLGSAAYRRAGGEPALYRSDPALFRLAV
jgi:hypothetical protein